MLIKDCEKIFFKGEEITKVMHAGTVVYEKAQSNPCDARCQTTCESSCQKACEVRSQCGFFQGWY